MIWKIYLLLHFMITIIIYFVIVNLWSTNIFRLFLFLILAFLNWNPYSTTAQNQSFFWQASPSPLILKRREKHLPADYGNFKKTLTWVEFGVYLEEMIRSLELENHPYDPHFFTSQEGNTEGGSSRDGSRRSSHKWTQSPNDAWLVCLFFLQNKKEVFLRQSCIIFHV